MQAQIVSDTGPDAIRAFMRERGFQSADDQTGAEALHALAAELIPTEVARPAVLAKVQRTTGHSLYLRYESGLPNAFLACFPLTAAGERAIHRGEFDGLRIGDDWVAPFSHLTRAGYIWALGGTTRGGAFAVMRALRIMRERFFSSIDLYARATTPAGASMMAGFGYLPFGGADPSMLLSPALHVAPIARAS